MKKPDTKTYEYISVELAKKNPEFWATVENAYKTQAAIAIQRQWRGDSEKMNNKSPLCFFHEASDDKYLEHVKKIQEGRWWCLDFEDADFTRNINKALRLEKISTDDMALAKLLYDARIMYKKNTINQYHLNDLQGPFDWKKIVYATENQIAAFHESIRRLPAKNQYYFCIDFSYEQELLYFYIGLMKRSIYTENFRFLLKKFLMRLPLHQNDKERVISSIDYLADKIGTGPTILVTDDIKERLAYLRNILKDSSTNKNILDFKLLNGAPVDNPVLDIEQHSALFMNELQEPNHGMPSILMSCNFNENKPDTPLLSQLIFDMSALKKLQKALFQSDVTFPVFRYGEISTREIKAYDENPKFFKNKSARPAELTHPDIVHSPVPHNHYVVYDFTLEYHDLAHSWLNSMIPVKNFVRYLRSILEKERGFDMSASIWRLSDMDFQGSAWLHYFHNKHAESRQYQIVRLWYICNIMQEVWSDFFYDTEKADTHLLLIIDMILHKEKWTTFLPKNLRHFLIPIPINRFFLLII